ncbi:MAG: Fe(2+) transporter permease subunit FeoB [Gammaproteobacteria bacterium]|nr:Fe(2+) transporter permease subunit FeoB [Gammaproteobacteria bacterium]
MHLKIGLVGNPNCGKTTLFNELTGSRQRVGNWPGVTVERKSGFFKANSTQVEVVDLPGTYSLITTSETSSVDERIACDFILSGEADLIVNIVDASNLERHLYLTLQLLEMQVPMIVVLNMMDVAQQRQIKISLSELEKKLGCKVVCIEAHNGKGIDELKQAIVAAAYQQNNKLDWYGDSLTQQVQQLSALIQKSLPEKFNTRSYWFAMRLLENDFFAQQLIGDSVKQIVLQSQTQLQEKLFEDADILFADARYRFIQTIMQQAVVKNNVHTQTWTERIDKIILNRMLGIPIFLVVMYLMFFFAINVGGAFQDFFDIGSNTIFVEGLAHLLTNMGLPNWLITLFANGIGKGINTTVTFIPVIGALFLFLAFLEDSGYMARAAFVVDRGMRALGLPGKSFVPMIVGFGCNVPAVMAARTLDNKRDRILTVMMSPFMSCGARLAIYAVFTAAFFPVGGQNVVFALYMIGIVMAMLTGLLLRKTVLQGEPAPMVMELPTYHVPQLKTVLLHAWQRLKGFLFRAGKLIIPICVLIGVLNGLNSDGSMNLGDDANAHSLLSVVGRFFTPIFAPMGIHQDNWPATVGLVTGVLAKEVVVGTLNTLYSQVGHLATVHAAGFSFWGGLHDAVMSIPENLSQLGSSLGNPVLAKAPVHTLSQSVYGLMYERFDGQIGAIAYLLFVLLYFPCISTTAAMLREVHRAWTWFSICWSTGIAYCVAVMFYQTATWSQHPVFSSEWLIGICSVLVMSIVSARVYSTNKFLKEAI